MAPGGYLFLEIEFKKYSLFSSFMSSLTYVGHPDRNDGLASSGRLYNRPNYSYILLLTVFCQNR